VDRGSELSGDSGRVGGVLGSRGKTRQGHFGKLQQVALGDTNTVRLQRLGEEVSKGGKPIQTR